MLQDRCLAVFGKDAQGGGRVLCNGRTVISHLRPQPWAGEAVRPK